MMAEPTAHSDESGQAFCSVGDHDRVRAVVAEVVGPALRAAAWEVWPFPDRPPLRTGVECGIVWAVVAGPVAGFNGYVLIPAEGHVFSRGFPPGWEHPDGELSALLDAPGGITYAEHPWIGFDTAHRADLQAPGHWTVGRVAAEAARLARQLFEINRREEHAWGLTTGFSVSTPPSTRSAC